MFACYCEGPSAGEESEAMSGAGESRVVGWAPGSGGGMGSDIRTHPSCDRVRGEGCCRHESTSVWLLWSRRQDCCMGKGAGPVRGSISGLWKVEQLAAVPRGSRARMHACTGEECRGLAGQFHTPAETDHTALISGAQTHFWGRQILGFSGQR